MKVRKLQTSLLNQEFQNRTKSFTPNPTYIVAVDCDQCSKHRVHNQQGHNYKFWLGTLQRFAIQFHIL